MVSYRVAVACVVIAVVLSLLVQPRFFWGKGPGSIVSLDDLFYAGQWAAVLFAILGLVCYGAAWKNGQLPSRAWVVLAFNIMVLMFLVLKGVPHSANRNEWRNGALGISHFIRGEAKRRAANTPPKQVSAGTFAGTWRGIDGSTYTFLTDRIAWNGTSLVQYTREHCGAPFSLEYIERTREALQDFGLTWSVHAIAVYDSTPAAAQIPVAMLTCGPEIVVFIRASSDEVWRVTSTLQLDEIRSASFVLQRAADAAKR